MIVMLCDIDAEPIPESSVPVLQVVLDAPHKVGSQSDVVETVLLVEGIDSSSPPNEIGDDVRVVFKHTPRDALKESE
jgi:hypothetical protein